MDTSEEISRLRTLYKAALDEKNYESVFDYCKQAALLGSAPAIHNLGLAYLFGKGVDVDLKIAMTCFTLAADCGVELSEKMIAEMYRDYRILSEKFPEYEREYSREEGERFCSLGTKIIYECDIGKTPDYKKAFKYFSEAAKFNHVLALEELGDLYRNGYGVDKDEKKAAQCFERANIFKNVNEKIDLYELSEEMREGILYEGKIIEYVEPKWLSEIRRVLDLSDKYAFTQSAGFGNADSMVELGRIYDKNGKPERAKKLYRRAFRCFKTAVESGDYSSVLSIIDMYREGIVNEPDIKDAIVFLNSCAGSDNTFAFKKGVWSAIGEIYRDGIGGVERDPRKADEYFFKAESLKGHQ